MDGGSNSNKRQVEAQGESSTKRQNVNMGLGTLDCSICLEPLRPLIFQCKVGHFICSSCHGKLLDMKCHKCNAKTKFKRCFGMEHVVQSVTVPCSNARHGCTNQLVYYEKEKHEKICPNAPCFCPESGCSFAGPARALVDHFTTQHKCQFTSFYVSNLVTVSLHLQPGVHVLHCPRDNHFFLFNMAPEPLGHAVSVVCVQPQATEAEFTCDMYYGSTTTDDSQSSCCKIRSSSLSDRLPIGYDLIVPKGKVSGEGNIIVIRATIRGNGKAMWGYDSEDDLPISRVRVTRKVWCGLVVVWWGFIQRFVPRICTAVVVSNFQCTTFYYVLMFEFMPQCVLLFLM